MRLFLISFTLQIDYPNEYVISLCLFTYLENGYDNIPSPQEYAGIINQLMLVNRQIFKSNRENQGEKLLCIQNGFEQCAVNKAWEHTVSNKRKTKLNSCLFSWLQYTKPSRNHVKKKQQTFGHVIKAYNAYVHEEWEWRFRSILSIFNCSKEHFIIINLFIIFENMKRV